MGYHGCGLRQADQQGKRRGKKPRVKHKPESGTEVELSDVATRATPPKAKRSLVCKTQHGHGRPRHAIESTTLLSKTSRRRGSTCKSTRQPTSSMTQTTTPLPPKTRTHNYDPSRKHLSHGGPKSAVLQQSLDSAQCWPIRRKHHNDLNPPEVANHL